MKIQFIYVTVPNREEALQIAETVVTEKLAACANLVEGVTSLFEWEGTLCRETEVLLFLKTTEDRVETLTDRIKQLHSYDCPCIVSLPIDGGNPDFLNWVGRN
jgi:periplasmic divalent cation tolerance protein